MAKEYPHIDCLILTVQSILVRDYMYPYICWFCDEFRLFFKFAFKLHIAHVSVVNLFQAVIYPYKISREGFVFENSALGKKNKAVVEKLVHVL